MSQFIKVEIKGTAKDAHERFPIRFDVSANGLAYFNGCRVQTEKDINGNTITDRIDIRAFGDVAEQLAAVSDGVEIHVKGDYGKVKNKKDGKYYEIVTVTEVISIDY